MAVQSKSGAYDSLLVNKIPMEYYPGSGNFWQFRQTFRQFRQTVEKSEIKYFSLFWQFQLIGFPVISANYLYKFCRNCRQFTGNAGIAENSQILDMYVSMDFWVLSNKPPSLSKNIPSLLKSMDHASNQRAPSFSMQMQTSIRPTFGLDCRTSITY